MADRDIHCKKCNTYLGTIRDAKLRKDIVYYCGTCDGARAFENLGNQYKPKSNDIFGDIFGGGFGRKK